MKETAAIMMTDIVGYTRLAKQDETSFIEICARYKRILRSKVTRFRGRTIHISGDKSLNIFSDPAAAVDCSMEIQQSLIDRYTEPG